MENIYQKVEGFAGVFTKAPVHTPDPGVPDGPLCGNGDIGIVAGVEHNTLTFWIGKNDMWYVTLPRKRVSNYSGCKCFGTIQICSELLQKAQFSALQKIESAEIEILMKTPAQILSVKAYTPYQQNLIVMSLTAQKGNIPLQLYLKPMEDPDGRHSLKTENNSIFITKDYVDEVEWETKSAALGRILGWKQPKGILTEGKSITFVVSIQTNHDTPNYIEQVRTDVDTLTPEKLDTYRQEHLAWWKRFWETSGILIPSEPEIEKFWYASHYLLACCSKAGKFAPGLFGNWTTTSVPNWFNDYTLNYNYQAPWWGAFSSNKLGLVASYDQPLMEYIPKAKLNAQRIGCRGIYAHSALAPKGAELYRMFRQDGTEELDAPFWGQKSNTAYAAINMAMRFYSTWDESYARKYAYPYLCEVGDFWEDYLKFENGRYVIYNDCIHECYTLSIGLQDWVPEDTPNHLDDFNPILTLGLLRMVFKALLDISDYLDVDEDRRKKWKHILTHLSDFPLQQRNGKTVFRYTERGMDWCDGNTLGIQHVFPCGAIGLSSDEKLLQIARDTLEEMARWEDYNGFPTFYTAAARLGYDPDVILGHMKEEFKKHGFDNLFIYYGGGGIECCSAVPSCVNEMLLQSHEGVLRFFPVWNKEKDAAFEHLRCYGAFVVSAELKDGKVGDISLYSEKGRPCSVLCPWEGGMEVLKDGEPVSCATRETRDGVVYDFATEQGAAYILKQK